VAETLTDTSLSAVLNALSAQRDPGKLRTSVMTHLVWAPKEWLAKAERVLADMAEQHPSRTVFLIPEPRRKDGLDASVDTYAFEIEGSGRSVMTEVVELRLRGERARAPASIVMPLLISDLPVFCRWRGEPPWGSDELGQILGVVDRLVVDSSEWGGLPRAYERLAELFERVAVSDIAWTRTGAWRARLAEQWPDIRLAGGLEVTGPHADSLLLAGWLRSRLRKQVDLEWRSGRVLRRVVVDGSKIEPPGDPLPTPAELLSEQLEVLTRDPIFEAAVRSAVD